MTKPFLQHLQNIMKKHLFGSLILNMLEVAFFFLICSASCTIKLQSDQEILKLFKKKKPYSGIYLNIAPIILDPSHSSPSSWTAPVQSCNCDLLAGLYFLSMSGSWLKRGEIQ